MSTLLAVQMNKIKPNTLTLTKPEGAWPGAGGTGHKETVLRVHGPMSPILPLFPADYL